MARYDLDGWAKALGADTDAEALAELRRWRQALEQAQNVIRPVYLRSIDAPDDHYYDAKRLLDCALTDCHVVVEVFGGVAGEFARHERGGR